MAWSSQGPELGGAVRQGQVADRAAHIGGLDVEQLGGAVVGQVQRPGGVHDDLGDRAELEGGPPQGVGVGVVGMTGAILGVDGLRVERSHVRLESQLGPTGAGGLGGLLPGDAVDQRGDAGQRQHVVRSGRLDGIARHVISRGPPQDPARR